MQMRAFSMQKLARFPVAASRLSRLTARAWSGRGQLEREPNNRYQTADDAVYDLERLRTRACRCLDTNPSLMPNTPARSAPERSPRCQGSRRAICVTGRACRRRAGARGCARARTRPRPSPAGSACQEPARRHPLPRSLDSQCAACLRSTPPGRGRSAARSPVSASACRECSAAASRSLASSSSHRQTDD